MIRRKKPFGLESLEAREMFAGDIAAYVQSGNLYLTEAAGQAGQANTAAIYQLANGQIRVEGRGDPGQASLINGAAYQDFTVPGSLYVNFGAGDDLLVIGAAGPGTTTPTFNDVHIDTAAPPPVFESLAAKSVQPTGPLNPPDNDDVIIWDVVTRGAMTINTGDGDDWVYISGARLGDGFGNDDLSIYTGAGADTVELKNDLAAFQGNIYIQTYASLAEQDNDVVWFEKAYSMKDIRVVTGGGADLLHMDNATAFHDLLFATGDGNDTVELDDVTVVDQLMGDLGNGDDSLSLDRLYGNVFNFQGDAGVDRLTDTADIHVNSLTLGGWEYVNGRPVWLINSIRAPISLTMKAV
jgi:hypothetical protein